MIDTQKLTLWSRLTTCICSDLGAMLLLGCLTSLTLIRVLWADFLSYDDPFYVTNNSLVQGGLSWKSLVEVWTTFNCANWHPGTWMSLMLDHQLYGMQAWGFHLTNLMLHVANTLLLYGLLRRFTLGWGQALFIAAVFGVHPLHVESVAWVTERKDVLATFFGLLSMLAYVRSAQSGTNWRWVASICWFALSLISKPLLVTLPCLLLLLDYWPLRRLLGHGSDGIRIRENSIGRNARTANPNSHESGYESITRKSFVGLILEKWPFWLLTLGSSVITVIAQDDGGAVASLKKFGILERLGNVCVSYCSYLQKSFWPTRLAVYYPYSLNSWAAEWVALAAALLMVITVLAWRLRHRHAGILLGWLWFLGTLVPMIGIIQVGTQAMADRYMYFPLIGLTWCVTTAVLACWPQSFLQTSPTLAPFQGDPCRDGAAASQLQALIEKTRLAGSADASPSPNPRRFAGLQVLAVTVVGLLSGLTWMQTAYWQNSLVLSQHTLLVAPENYIAHELHARALRVAGLNAHAMAEYRRAIAINPNYFAARNDLGLLLAQQGDLPEAVEQFRLGLKVVPNHGRLRWNLANTLGKQGQFDAADAEFRLAESSIPNNDSLILDHARMLEQAGRYKSAIKLFERAVELAPASLVNQLELAVALSRSPKHKKSDLVRSISILEKLCATTDAPRAWTTLAEVLSAAGRRSEAETAWEHAIQRAVSLNRSDLADLARASRQRCNK